MRCEFTRTGVRKEGSADHEPCGNVAVLPLQSLLMTSQNRVTGRVRADWEELLAHLEPLHVTYPPAEMISRVGTYVAGVHAIAEGIVAESVQSEDGAIECLALLGPGDLLGLEVLFPREGALASTSSRAVTLTRLVFVEAKQFREGIDRDSTLRWAVVSELARRVGLPHVAAMSRVGECGAQERICRTLRRLVDLCGVVEDDGIALQGLSLRLFSELACVSRDQLRRTLLAGLTLREEQGALWLDGLDAKAMLAS